MRTQTEMHTSPPFPRIKLCNTTIHFDGPHLSLFGYTLRPVVLCIMEAIFTAVCIEIGQAQAGRGAIDGPLRLAQHIVYPASFSCAVRMLRNESESSSALNINVIASIFFFCFPIGIDFRPRGKPTCYCTLPNTSLNPACLIRLLLRTAIASQLGTRHCARRPGEAHQDQRPKNLPQNLQLIARADSHTEPPLLPPCHGARTFVLVSGLPFPPSKIERALCLQAYITARTIIAYFVSLPWTL